MNKDLSIGEADMLLTVTLVNYDGCQKKVTMVLDSSDDWRGMTGESNSFFALNFWGALMMSAIEHDIMIEHFTLEYYHTVNGQINDLGVPQYFVRDGKRFKKLKVKRDGTQEFLEDNEF